MTAASAASWGITGVQWGSEWGGVGGAAASTELKRGGLGGQGVGGRAQMVPRQVPERLALMPSQNLVQRQSKGMNLSAGTQP